MTIVIGAACMLVGVFFGVIITARAMRSIKRGWEHALKDMADDVNVKLKEAWGKVEADLLERGKQLPPRAPPLDVVCEAASLLQHLQKNAAWHAALNESTRDERYTSYYIPKDMTRADWRQQNIEQSIRCARAIEALSRVKTKD